MLIAANNNNNVVSVILDNTKPKSIPKVIQSKHNPNSDITTSNAVAEHKCSYEYVYVALKKVSSADSQI